MTRWREEGKLLRWMGLNDVAEAVEEGRAATLGDMHEYERWHSDTHTKVEKDQEDEGGSFVHQRMPKQGEKGHSPASRRRRRRHYPQNQREKWKKTKAIKATFPAGHPWTFWGNF
jgi:hypothetical protein